MDELLRGLIGGLSFWTPETVRTVSGGLTIRAMRNWHGYRITLERRQVIPSKYEVNAIKASLERLGHKIGKEGDTESGAIMRHWINIDG